MKITVIFFLFFWSSFYSYAQHRTFLRIYNADGKKIAKGYFVNTTDSFIQLEHGSKVVEVQARQINLIKSKRAKINRILATSGKVVVGVIIVITFIAWIKAILSGTSHNKNSNNNKENSVQKTKPVKPFKEYRINNNMQTWQQQRILLAQLW